MAGQSDPNEWFCVFGLVGFCVAGLVCLNFIVNAHPVCIVIIVVLYTAKTIIADVK